MSTFLREVLTVAVAAAAVVGVLVSFYAFSILASLR